MWSQGIYVSRAEDVHWESVMWEMTWGHYGSSGQNGEVDTFPPHPLPGATFYPSILLPGTSVDWQFSTDCGLTQDLLCQVMGWQESWPLGLAFPHAPPSWPDGYAQTPGNFSPSGCTCISSLQWISSVTCIYLHAPSAFLSPSSAEEIVLLTLIKPLKDCKLLERQRKKKAKLSLIFCLWNDSSDSSFAKDYLEVLSFSYFCLLGILFYIFFLASF